MAMQIECAIVAVLAGVVLWMSVKATVLVLRDSLSESKQQLLQLLLVWLIPILGPIIVFGVHRPLEKNSGKYYEPAPEPDDSFGFPSYGARSGRDRMFEVG